jgi:hypothetical protein
MFRDGEEGMARLFLGPKNSVKTTGSPLLAIKIFSPRNFSSFAGKVGIIIFAEIS